MYFKKIKLLRLECKKTQEEISKEIGFSQSNYCKWERGKEIIPLEKLFLIAKYYNLSIDYLTDLSKERKAFTFNSLNKNIIGGNIKNLRKEKSITQKQLASLLVTTQSTVSAFESGKVLILTKFIYKIAKKYNLSVDEMCSIR